MSNLKNLLNTCKHHDTIIFGPFFGEFGWEIYKWAPFVRWYAKNHRQKRVIASTREDRIDLYHKGGCAVRAFSFKEDYKSAMPVAFSCRGLPQRVSNSVVNKLRSEFPNALFVRTSAEVCPVIKGAPNRYRDYAFEGRNPNKAIVAKILKENEGKIPIALFSRERVDTVNRNWGVDNWNRLFDLLQNTDKYVVFVCGIAPSFCRSEGRSNLYNMEDYVKKNASAAGLMIESIKASRLSVGSQSAFLSLSHFLRIPTLFWGHEIQRHAVTENIYKTKSVGLLDEDYNIKPMKIFKQIESNI